MVGDTWWVDLAAQQSHPLHQEGEGIPLAWTAEGIVFHQHDETKRLDVLWLLDEEGHVQGEIDLYP